MPNCRIGNRFCRRRAYKCGPINQNSIGRVGNLRSAISTQCIRIKTQLYSAKLHHHCLNDSRCGMNARCFEFSLASVMVWKNRTVETLQNRGSLLMRKPGIGVLQTDKSASHHRRYDNRPWWTYTLRGSTMSGVFERDS